MYLEEKMERRFTGPSVLSAPICAQCSLQMCQNQKVHSDLQRSLPTSGSILPNLCQAYVQAAFEDSKDETLQPLWVACASALFLCSEKLFPDVQITPLLFQFVPSTSYPGTGLCWKALFSIFISRICTYWWEIPLSLLFSMLFLSAFPQRRDASVPNNLYGSILDCFQYVHVTLVPWCYK